MSKNGAPEPLRSPPGESATKSDPISYFVGAPGTPSGRQNGHQSQNKQVRHDIFAHSFFQCFSATCFPRFCHLSRCLKPRKCSKNVVLSSKTEGTTDSPPNLIFSKISPESDPPSDPRNHTKQKKTPTGPPLKTHSKKRPQKEVREGGVPDWRGKLSPVPRLPGSGVYIDIY